MKFSGRLADFSLPDVLRIVVQSQKAGYLLISFKGEDSYIYVSQGELHHAESQGLTGENAVFHLMSFETDAEFEFVEQAELPEKTIQSALDTLLQKGIAYLETWRKVARQYPRFTVNTEIVLLSDPQSLAGENESETEVLNILSASSQALHQILEQTSLALMPLVETLESLEKQGHIQVVGEERVELKRFFIEMANTLYSEFESISGLKLKQETLSRLENLIVENNWNIDLQNGRIVGDKIRTATMEEQKSLYGEYLTTLIELISPIYGVNFIQQVMNKVEQRLTVPIHHWIEELNLKV